METVQKKKAIPFEVDKCPACGGKHVFHLTEVIGEQVSSVFMIPMETETVACALVCPTKGTTIVVDVPVKLKESKNQTPSGEARFPTQTELALLEYGKQVLIKSSETAVDFHKTMLSVSATFGTLITTVTPILIWGDPEKTIPMPESSFLILPLLLMLLSAFVFALGYYPRYLKFNPNIIDEVRRVRERIIKSRSILAGVGLFLFCISLLSLAYFALRFHLS